jgi:hypothetical protein
MRWSGGDGSGRLNTPIGKTDDSGKPKHICPPSAVRLFLRRESRLVGVFPMTTKPNSRVGFGYTKNGVAFCVECHSRLRVEMCECGGGFHEVEATFGGGMAWAPCDHCNSRGFKGWCLNQNCRSGWIDEIMHEEHAEAWLAKVRKCFAERGQE